MILAGDVVQGHIQSRSHYDCLSLRLALPKTVTGLGFGNQEKAGQRVCAQAWNRALLAGASRAEKKFYNGVYITCDACHQRQGLRSGPARTSADEVRRHGSP